MNSPRHPLVESHDAVLLAHDAVLLAHDAVLLAHDAALLAHDAALLTVDAPVLPLDAANPEVVSKPARNVLGSETNVDVCIVGAGIIGLSLALELSSHGISVLVLDQSTPMREASWAAAGMLSALDPSNPPALHPLAQLSLHLYPAFLSRLAKLSGQPVQFRSTTTLLGSPATTKAHHESGLPIPHTQFLSRESILQLAPSLDPGPLNWALLDEPSLDPRDLCSALPKAANAVGIRMQENTAWLSTHLQENKKVVSNPCTSRRLRILTTGAPVFADTIIHCTGAWTAAAFPQADNHSGIHPRPASGIRPRKGQMLSLNLPPDVDLKCTVHAPGCYIVPRGDGRVIVGATIEDCGFDKSLTPAAFDDLLARAIRLIPALARATVLERWAGLRPGSPDDLPLLGPLPSSPGSFVAAGHYRMGILLAPATARVLAQLVLGQPPEIDLTPFNPLRFTVPQSDNSFTAAL